MKQIIFCCCMLLIVAATAQTKNTTGASSKKITYSGNLQIGVLNGSSKSALELKTIQGLQYHSWFAGAGVSLDNYLYRTVPLFINIRKNLVNKSSYPYLFADAGISLPWVQHTDNFWWSSYKYNSGLYYDAGAGYSFSLAKKYALLFNAAYSFKKVKETVTPFCELCPPPSSTPDIKNEYSLRRLSLSLGWMF